MAITEAEQKTITDSFINCHSGVQLVTLQLTGELNFTNHYDDNVFGEMKDHHIVKVIPTRVVVQDLPQDCAIKEGKPRDEIEALFGKTIVIKNGDIEIVDILLTRKCLLQCTVKIAGQCVFKNNSIAYLNRQGDNVLEGMSQYLENSK
ncbi:MAG: hypothetical protein WCK31_04980 [bacterium]